MTPNTLVELYWLQGRIERWIRFGNAVDERIVNRRQRVFAFAPGSVFAYIRWASNEYGTLVSRLDIVRAVLPGEPCSTIPFVAPGGEVLLRAFGWPKVRLVLTHIDAIEAFGIDPVAVDPNHWRHACRTIGTIDETVEGNSMCFSATASFTAAAILLPLGGLSLQRAWRDDRRYLALGALPLLFGVQQLFEGLVWHAGESGDAITVARYSLAYMFFSWLAWPVWVPFSTYFVEPARRRPIYLMFAVAGGILGGLQYVPYFAHQGWLTTQFLPHAISYNGTALLDLVIGQNATYLIYVGVVIGPLLLSTKRDVKIFGVLVAFVLVTTVMFFRFAYISVFCFGGALMSLYLVWRPFTFRRNRVDASDHSECGDVFRR